MKQINIRDYFHSEIEKLRNSTSKIPSLLIIDATDGDIGNQIYIKKKVEDFKSLNWPVEVVKPITQNTLNYLLENNNYDCVIVQMPVSKFFQFAPSQINPNQDCDGLNLQSGILPATVRGIIDYLDKCEFPYSGNTATVIGRSDIVGKPMAQALLNKDMTVIQCHSKTPIKQMRLLMQQSQLVVSAVGKAHFIDRQDCGPQATVVDVGITRDSNNHITGDFKEIPNYFKNQGWSTPVPGGVGLLTRLGLIKNCLDLMEAKQCINN